MSDIENLLNDAADNGTLIGRGQTSKGAHYAVFKHNDRYFTGVFHTDTYGYICGAEEITKDHVKDYIGDAGTEELVVSVEKKLLKRVYDLLNEGDGFVHLEVDGVEAEKILEEIRKLGVA